MYYFLKTLTYYDKYCWESKCESNALSKNEKVEHHTRMKTHKSITLSFLG